MSTQNLVLLALMATDCWNLWKTISVSRDWTGCLIYIA